MDTTNSRMKPIAALLVVAIVCATSGHAQARNDSGAASPHGTALEAADALEPGEFAWEPQRAGSGQVVVVVSLPEQRAHVYRNGIRIGVSTISSGKAGKETPTGNFEILQKRREHYSNLYDNAPMPFMQRLTWDGIALHGGALPGYPASNGCIRLPKRFAELLFTATERGGRVVVADAASHPLAVVYPGDRAPVDAYSGEPVDGPRALAASGEGLASGYPAFGR